MEIYNGLDNVVEVIENDSSYRFTELPCTDEITLSFSTTEYIDFVIGAYIIFQNKQFTMYEPAKFTKVSEREYSYTLVFKSNGQLTMYRFLNTVDRRVEFTLTATAKEYLEHIVNNLNEREEGWTVGDYISSGYKTLSFSHNTILDALQSVATAFDTEFYIQDKRVSLRKLEYNVKNPIKLSYGRGNGLKSGITRQISGETAIDVLWVMGGDRNINYQTYKYIKDGKEYGAKKLHLPINQTFFYVPLTTDDISESQSESTEIDNGRIYTAAEWNNLDNEVRSKLNAMEVYTDKDGYRVCRKNRVNNGYEESLDCSDIYPKRVCTVTSVTNSNPSAFFWEIFDSNNNINYSQYVMENQKPTIVFESGMLTGKEFNFGYNNSEKRFDIQPTEIDGIQMPNTLASGFVPKVGDKFAVFHVKLPQEYIDSAEKEMLLTACRYLYNHTEIEVEYHGELDGIWAEKVWDNISPYIRLGGYIKLVDKAFCPNGKNIRIVGIKTYLCKPHQPELTLSNTSVAQGVSSQIKKIANDQVAISEGISEFAAYTQRRYEDSKETADLINNNVKDLGQYNFSESINPSVVETLMMLIGDEGLQFEFGHTSAQYGQRVTDFTLYSPEYEPLWTENGLRCPDVDLRHLVYTNYYKIMGNPSEKDILYPYWRVISKQEYFVPAVKEKAYYLYIVAPKKATSSAWLGKLYSVNAVFELFDTPKKDTEDFYYLWVGILNAEFGGQRSFASVWGKTEILGNRISTDIIKSNSGNTYIDLKNDIIKGKFNFTDGIISNRVWVGKTENTAIAGLGGYDSSMGANNVLWAGKKGSNYKFQLLDNGVFYVRDNNMNYICYVDQSTGQLMISKLWCKGRAYFNNIEEVQGYIKVKNYVSAKKGYKNYGDFVTSADGRMLQKFNFTNGSYTYGIVPSLIYLSRWIYQKSIGLKFYDDVNGINGRIDYITSDGGKSIKGISMIVTRYQEGCYKFKYKETPNFQWFVTAQCCGEGSLDNQGYVAVQRFPSKGNEHGFFLTVADDASPNDFSFEVQIWAYPNNTTLSTNLII